MKASEFKNLIKEAVREVLKEELMEIVQPPVQESSPSLPLADKPVYKATGNAMLDALNETRSSMSTQDYRNVLNMNSSMAPMFRPGTQAAIQSAPKAGLDISNLGFVKNAAEIVKIADKKQKEKYGL